MRYLILILTLMVASGAQAQSELRQLETLDDAKKWRSVGLLRIANSASCTGALIAPDQVLTAAHCVFNSRTNEQVRPSQIEFYAGWRSGSPEAKRIGRRIAITKDYVPSEKIGETSAIMMTRDLALIELDQPLDRSQFHPFPIQKHVEAGTLVSIVSYAKGRTDTPAIQENCDIIQRVINALVMDCAVDFGASGSPVFIQDGEQIKIASVVSAMDDADDQRLAFGMQLRDLVSDLQAELATDNSVFQGKKPGQSLSEQLGRN